MLGGTGRTNSNTYPELSGPPWKLAPYRLPAASATRFPSGALGRRVLLENEKTTYSLWPTAQGEPASSTVKNIPHNPARTTTKCVNIMRE